MPSGIDWWLKEMSARVLEVERLVDAVQLAYSTTSSVVLKKDKTPEAEFGYLVTLGKGEAHVGYASKKGSLFSFFDLNGTLLTKVDISEPREDKETETEEDKSKDGESSGFFAEPGEGESKNDALLTCKWCLAANMGGA